MKAAKVSHEIQIQSNSDNELGYNNEYSFTEYSFITDKILYLVSLGPFIDTFRWLEVHNFVIMIIFH